jgi:hypothetical protein
LVIGKAMDWIMPLQKREENSVVKKNDDPLAIVASLILT